MKLLQESDDKFRESTGFLKIKFVEKGGVSLKDILCKNNPWGNNKCEREKWLCCPYRKDGKGGTCRREGVVYTIVCTKCEQEGKKAEYWEETFRTGYERGEEHVAGLESKYEKNPLCKHSFLHHRGELERGDMKMIIVESHRSALNRQIHEGVELEMNKADIILNSKSEWNNSGIPRIVIEVGDEVEEDDNSGMIRSTELGGKERRRGGNECKESWEEEQ